MAKVFATESANQGFLPRLRLPTDPDPTSPGQFVDPGTNGRFFTSQAPVTTFSVDVDRASYTYARRVLRAGQMPTPASVRTEEFVNALTYDGPVPTDAPLSVRIRHRGALIPCEVDAQPDATMSVRFLGPARAVSPGQAAVIYQGERVVGGGWIDRAVEPA